jgi:DME family drug/metabolite transporter
LAATGSGKVVKHPEPATAAAHDDQPLVAAADAGAEAAESGEHRHHARNVGRGTAFSLFSALLYTCTNIGLRDVAHLDVFWVSCLKAVPTLAAAGLIVAYDLSQRGRGVLPSRRAMLGLLLTGVVAHLGGNVAFQWGLGIVGLAAAVPLTFSMILVCGALLGRFWLGEAITLRAIAAMAVLTVAFVCVSVHTESVAMRPVVDVPHNAATTALAVGVVCFSGLAYSLLGASIRRTVTGTASMSAVLLFVSIPGIVGLLPIAVARLGWSGIAATSPRDWAVSLLAGVCNAVAFFSLTRAMQLVPVSYVNVVNASQVAMAAAAGVALFHEPTTAWLWTGLVLTVVGLVCNQKPKRA